MKEKTLIIIIKQVKTFGGGTTTTTEKIGDKELIKVLKESLLEELLMKIKN